MKRISILFLSTILFFLISFSSVAEQQMEPWEIMEKYGDAVVVIAGAKDTRDLGLGSGFIVKNDGVIVTNYHVIAGAYPVFVKLKNGDVYEDILVIDYNERKDIAVIKVKGFDLPTLQLGNSNNVKVGENVVVIGNPHGFENTISNGLLSQIRSTELGYRLHQISAPISHGSSGSPVFNNHGEVIGIATLSDVWGQNLNFSVPINYIRGMTDGPVKHTLEEFAKIVQPPSVKSIDKEDVLMACDFEDWPNNLGGEIGVYGSLEPNWDKVTTVPYSWVYEPITPRYDQSNVYSGKNSFRLVNALGIKRNLKWGSFAIDLGPVLDLATIPKTIQSLDVSGYKYLIFWVKGERGGEKMQVLFRDAYASNYNPQVFYSVPAAIKEWQRIDVPLSDVAGEVNLRALDNIGIAFGRDIGNKKGTIVYLDDFCFTNGLGSFPHTAAEGVENIKINLEPVSGNYKGETKPTEDEMGIYQDIEKGIWSLPSSAPREEEDKIVEKVAREYGITYEQANDVYIKVTAWNLNKKRSQ